MQMTTRFLVRLLAGQAEVAQDPADRGACCLRCSDSCSVFSTSVTPFSRIAFDRQAS